MRRSIAAMLFCLASSLPANSTELGNKQDAVALVDRVKESFKKDGAAATFTAITAQSERFRDHELYVFVYDMTGKVIAHGGDPRLVGQTRLDLRDQNGKPVIAEMIKTARRYSKGWVDYCWPNAVTVEDISSFVELLDGKYVVGVPVLRQDPALVQAFENH